MSVEFTEEMKRSILDTSDGMLVFFFHCNSLLEYKNILTTYR
jgi:hypothetical protein